jgi:ATP-dependent DNA helicase PIF1
MNLSPTQKRAYDLSMTGSSLLITGSAGTGKSYLLKHIYNGLTGMNKKVAITALTGCAAYLLTEDLGIKVHTIHSWVGFGYGDDEAKNYITKINKTHPLRQRWRNTDTLIIDEISMMSATTFDKIEQIARGVRGKDWGDRPFGGLQVICVGDFYQLPPVVRQSYSAAANASAVQALFAFQAQSWPTLIKHIVVLETIYRQNDPHFQKILEEARHGQLSEASIDALKERTTVDWKKNTIKPTLVFTKRAVVEDINRRNLDVLKGTKYSYSVKTLIEPRTTIRGIERLAPDDVIVKDAVAKLDADATYVAELTLSKKAQVMLIKNIDVGKGLVNGSRGVIVDICPKLIRSEKKFADETLPYPSSEKVRTDIENGYMEVYSKTIEEGKDKGRVEVYKDTYKYYPIVLFVGQTEPMLIEPHAWASKMEESVSRSQIPLVLAWAVTTHKIQGATLDCALIDIGDDVFEYGQAYVALSRVKSLDSLYVHNLVPSCVRAHPLVKEFYKSVKEVTQAQVSVPAQEQSQEENPTNYEAEREKTSIPPKNYFSIFKPARTLGQ